ncbi:MAG: hypothetical protein COB69_09750 [Phycisphaera sp.]|nr:MAG: hypothetical protein COB69_09750 [Phycisphaera sp.]
MGENIQVEVKSGPERGATSQCAAGISERLKEVTAGHSCKQIAEMYGISSESIRRYLRGGRPSVQFLIDVALQTETSLDWLILGRGARNYKDAKQLWQSETTQIQLTLREIITKLDCIVTSVK